MNSIFLFVTSNLALVVSDEIALVTIEDVGLWCLRFTVKLVF